MEDVDPRRLRERFLARLLAAWPERDLDVRVIEQDLALAIGSDADGPAIVVSLLGSTVWFGFDGSPAAAWATVDEAADHLADELEADRWMAEGWREHRPSL